jgi:hypothetical protein
MLGEPVERPEAEFTPGPELSVAAAIDAYRQRQTETEAAVRRLPLDTPTRRGTAPTCVRCSSTSSTRRHATPDTPTPPAHCSTEPPGSEPAHERFGVAGNDAGSMVSPEVGRLAPDRLVGVHVTQVFSFQSGDPAEFEKLTEADYAALAHLQWFQDTKGAFNVVQGQQPQTLAHALADSPAGLAGWNGQLLGELPDDLAVANLALYWLTDTTASSMRL